MRQLTAEWSYDRQYVIISRGKEELLRHPVEYVHRGSGWIKSKGNRKTEHGKIGIVSCLSNGCFRALTNCGRCSTRCYADAGEIMSGCYADISTHAMIHWNDGYSVIHNGYAPGTEKFFHVRLPKNGSYDLSMYPTKVYRVDSESSTTCMSLALGIMQTWAEANPKLKFTGISSDYFHVSDEMLEWASSCGNIVVGHTISPWFTVDDIRNRIKSAHRWQDAGVATMLWVATRPEWEKKNPHSRALVDAEIVNWDVNQIIEVPYHDRVRGHSVHSLKVNPLGGCCEVGVDVKGKYHKMDSGVKLSGSCRGCKVLCGIKWLKRA